MLARLVQSFGAAKPASTLSIATRALMTQTMGVIGGGSSSVLPSLCLPTTAGTPAVAPSLRQEQQLQRLGGMFGPAVAPLLDPVPSTIGGVVEIAGVDRRVGNGGQASARHGGGCMR